MPLDNIPDVLLTGAHSAIAPIGGDRTLTLRSLAVRACHLLPGVDEAWPALLETRPAWKRLDVRVSKRNA